MSNSDYHRIHKAILHENSKKRFNICRKTLSFRWSHDYAKFCIVVSELSSEWGINWCMLTEIYRIHSRVILKLSSEAIFECVLSLHCWSWHTWSCDWIQCAWRRRCRWFLSIWFISLKVKIVHMNIKSSCDLKWVETVFISRCTPFDSS